VTVAEGHDWALTAPWWRWPKLGTPNRDVRALPPAIQMYDASDPVTGFVKEPQKALKFQTADEVHVLSGPGPIPPGGRLGSFSNRTLTSNGTRKLFLPIHKRFYLVVCELHCDIAGFPSVARDKVCEAGMVIRRRKLSVGAEHAPQALEIMKAIGAATARIAHIDRSTEKRVLKKRHPVGATSKNGKANGGGLTVATKSRIHAALDATAAAERAKLEGELASARAQLKAWQVDSGATVVSEGWVASDFENVGSWQAVLDDASAVTETVYPLFPLVADPRNPLHDGAGKTIWFGVLPTGSREVELNGDPRFDDESRYQVRCFVRRHREPCPRTGEPNDCGGELFWSAPSEVFQLAPHFDPVGTGNHPITIQMPDIPTLAASAPSTPVAMKFPAGSALGFQVDAEELKISAPKLNSLPQICYFSIPLITIIATFVLMLFLPIVVLIFQLWFMLALKFCILPSLQIQMELDGSISAEIDAQLQLSASLDVAIGAFAGVELDQALAANLNLNIAGDAFATVDEANDEIDTGAGFTGSPGDVLQKTYATSVLQELNTAVTTDRGTELDTRSIVAGLEFTGRVERVEVGA
jgi:hypothetical protein